MSQSPYADLPSKAFWRQGVTDRHIAELDDLYTPKFAISVSDKIATAGSCFAQHVARHLRASGCSVIDAEPLPEQVPDDVAIQFGFRQYSARYANIYTARQLKQLLLEARGQVSPAHPVWEKDGRFFDAQRPSVEPTGMDTADDVVESRRRHLRAVTRVFDEADVFVFTFGLTECWEHIATGTVYPTAPGTIAGDFDAGQYRFKNLTFAEVFDDFTDTISLLRETNPNLRFLLTVSPVPLTATATDHHVLTATTYSKSVLRSVAGQLADEDPLIDYFPSYELIASPPSAGFFYAPNQRDISTHGVETVMAQFLKAHGLQRKTTQQTPTVDVACEEMLLEAFGK